MTDQTYAQIVAELDFGQPAQVPPDRRVTVLVNMKHLRNYGRGPVCKLTYGCDFPVAVGDTVAVPPTRLNAIWTEGTVIALEADGYSGPVRYVKPA